VCLSTILPASNLGRFLGAAKINKYGGLIGWYWFDEEVLCEYLKCYDCVSRCTHSSLTAIVNPATADPNMPYSTRETRGIALYLLQLIKGCR
jgi:hypothetical protein